MKEAPSQKSAGVGHERRPRSPLETGVPRDSAGFRLCRHQQATARRPLFVFFHSIPGFAYLRFGRVFFWRDGWRFGVGK